MLLQQKFFKDHPTLSLEDIQEIARLIMVKKVHAMENVIEFGDLGQNFYIVLKGVVAIEVPNEKIKNRAIKFKDYEMIKKWEKDEFAPRE